MEYGTRKTLYNRFVRWAVRGVWERVFAMRFDRLDVTFVATLCIAAALIYFLK